MAQVRLQGPGIVAVVGELVAGGMPEHVRMALERQPRLLARPAHQEGETSGCERPTALGHEHEV
jgi:hypothetical protein